MDSARHYEPHTILLWKKVAEQVEAQRLIALFPSAQVQIIDRQNGVTLPHQRGVHPILGGKRVLMIGEASSFIRSFDGQLGESARCRPYLKLVPLSNGCPYYCTYCYLAYIYRQYHSFIKVNVNCGRMFDELRRAVTRNCGDIAFNMGEMLDSLALDHVTNLTPRLVPFFRNLPGAYLMLLTKSANIDNLLTVKPTNRVIVSWSLNSRRMIETHEIGTAGLDERLDAARRCQSHGYRIRFRIDPGFLYPNWQADYAEMVQTALQCVPPENITLGMLRLLPGHLPLIAQAYGDRGRDLRRHHLVEKASDGKLRYTSADRIAFYRFLIDTIRCLNDHVSISLCRETPDIWRALGHLCHPSQCNCLPWRTSG
jgi:spore photoproduct lyase